MNSRVTIILVIMAIYLAGMLWIGLKGRKYSETNKDFMTAAKQGSWKCQEMCSRETPKI